MKTASLTLRSTMSACLLALGLWSCRALGEEPAPSPIPTPLPGVLTSTPAEDEAASPTPSPVPVERPLEMKAGSVRYTQDRTYATGGVDIVADDAHIHADQIELDNNTLEIVARGNVNLTRGATSVSADRMVYNAHTRHAVLFDVVGRGGDFGFRVRPITGELFFWAQSMEWDGRQAVLLKGTITTCDLPPWDQHYHITADKVTITPNDAVVITKARLFEHKSELLGVPKAQFSLKRGEKGRHTLFPQFGFNNVDGLFVKESIPYGGNKNFYGDVHVDYFSNSGLGGGFTNHLRLGDKGESFLYYYSLNSRVPGANRYELTSRINYAFDNGINLNWFLDTSQFGQPFTVAPVNFNSLISLSKSGPRYTLSLTGTTTSISEGQFTNLNTGYNFLYRAQLSDTLSNLLAVDYTTQSTAQLSSFRLHTLEHLNQVGPLFDTSLDYETTSGTSSFFVNREPEVTFRSNRVALEGLPLNVSLAVGEFDEQPTNVRLMRTNIDAEIPEQEFRPWDGGTVYAQGGLRQLFYQNGDAEYIMGFRSGWIQDLGEHVTTRLDLASQTPNGFSPFQTDFVDTYQNVAAGLEISNKDYWRASVMSGYDIHRGLFQSILGRLNVNLNQQIGGTMAANFDVNTHTLDNVDGELRLRLTPQLYVHTYDLYDVVNHRLTYNDFALTHESHDFLTQLVYRGVQNEFYLQFAIKGFPFQSASIGTNPGSVIQGVPGAPSGAAGLMFSTPQSSAQAPYGL